MFAHTTRSIQHTWFCYVCRLLSETSVTLTIEKYPHKRIGIEKETERENEWQTPTQTLALRAQCTSLRNNNQVIHKRICFFLSPRFCLDNFILPWCQALFFSVVKEDTTFFFGPTLCTWIIPHNTYTLKYNVNKFGSQNTVLCVYVASTHSDCDPFCIHFHLSVWETGPERESELEWERM